VIEFEIKSVSVVISSCFVPISVMILVAPTTKSPVMDTLPDIVPPVSSYLLSNADCNPFVFAMVKSPSSMVSCLSSNTDCNPFVFAMVKLPSSMVSCLSSNADCNPSVFAMVKLPSAISSCLSSNADCNPPVFAMAKSPSSIVSCLSSNADCNPPVFAMAKSPSSIVSCLFPISVTRLVSPTKNDVPSMEAPVIFPVVVKVPYCCEILPNTLVPTNVVLP
jgi:hypothetical protein